MYEIKDGCYYHIHDKGRDKLTNFVAQIKRELRLIDGRNSKRQYEIEGRIGGVDPESDEGFLEPVVVDSEDFASMSWISNAWGNDAIILPSPSAKEIVRTAIQLSSKPVKETIYTHLGWETIDGKDTFLANGVAINGEGPRIDLNVQVPGDLTRFTFPVETSEEQIKEGILNSFRLLELGPRDVMWMMLAATYRSAFGGADFAVHVTGRTGTYKSELASLFQSHFGMMTARDLPASWGSTPNALEALAYRAKDVLMCVDDFIPAGTSWQQKQYQKTADQLIRGQGNQAGRARLTDTSNMQTTMYPRCLTLSTGEDTPEGHSVRGRMMIAELSPGDINLDKLSKAQAARKSYAHAMRGFIQWLASDLKQRRADFKALTQQERDGNRTAGHTRTPEALGQLLAGTFAVLSYCVEIGVCSTEKANAMFADARKSLIELATRQVEYVVAADPAEQFIGILRSIFAASAGHLIGMSGGIPKKAPLLGWSAVGSGKDAEWKSHGQRLGWVDDNKGVVYLDAGLAYDVIRRHSRGAITITRQTLYKRLKEAGHLAGTDEGRQRNTVRVVLEGATRMVLAVYLNAILEGEQNGQAKGNF